MPALNYQKELAPKILSGEKPFTLRDHRKDGRDPKIGETLFMFTGQRSKQCKKFAERRCRFTVTISLGYCRVAIPGLTELLWPDHLENFARLDGFASYAAFCKFHGVRVGMSAKSMRLIAWVTRDELKQLLKLTTV